MMFWYNFVKS